MSKDIYCGVSDLRKLEPQKYTSSKLDISLGISDK